MTPSSTRLERALDLMIQVVSQRPDGENYVPIVLHLEDQIAAVGSAESEYQRIRRLAQKTAT